MRGDSQNLGITKNTYQKMSSRNNDLGTRLDITIKLW